MDDDNNFNYLSADDDNSNIGINNDDDDDNAKDNGKYNKNGNIINNNNYNNNSKNNLIKTDCTRVYHNKEFKENLCKNLNNLRKEGKFCDWLLKTQDGYEFLVHKNILVATSSYFAGVLNSGMLECYQNYLLIQNISGKCLELIIEYIYSGKIILNENIVQEILENAMYFGLLSLIDICSKYLSEFITIDNSLNLWRYAETFSGQILKKKCIEHILQQDEEIFENELIINTPTSPLPSPIPSPSPLPSSSLSSSTITLQTQSSSSSSSTLLLPLYKQLTYNEMKTLIFYENNGLLNRMILCPIIKWIMLNYNERSKYIDEFLNSIKMIKISDEMYASKILLETNTKQNDTNFLSNMIEYLKNVMIIKNETSLPSSSSSSSLKSAQSTQEKNVLEILQEGQVESSDDSSEDENDTKRELLSSIIKNINDDRLPSSSLQEKCSSPSHILFGEPSNQNNQENDEDENKSKNEEKELKNDCNVQVPQLPSSSSSSLSLPLKEEEIKTNDNDDITEFIAICNCNKIWCQNKVSISSSSSSSSSTSSSSPSSLLLSKTNKDNNDDNNGGIYLTDLLQIKEFESHYALTRFLTNDLILCGGINLYEKGPCSLCKYYSTENNEWYDLPSMKETRFMHSAINYFNKIYALGGFNNPTIEIFDIEYMSWIYGPSLKKREDNYDICTMILNNNIYALGGRARSFQFLDIRNSNWIELPIALDVCMLPFSPSIAFNNFIYYLSDKKVKAFDIRNNLWLDTEYTYKNDDKLKQFHVLLLNNNNNMKNKKKLIIADNPLNLGTICIDLNNVCNFSLSNFVTLSSNTNYCGLLSV